MNTDYRCASATRRRHEAGTLRLRRCVYRNAGCAVVKAQSFAPLTAAGCRILILGSMPGIASLDAGQYYAHPRNAFWPITGALFGFDASLDYASRCRALNASGVALWDVLRFCERQGSLDSAIVDATSEVNDFQDFFERFPDIHTVAFNGAKAQQCFRRGVHAPLAGIERRFVRLPSTSPANAGMRFEQKLEAWSRALLP